MSDVHGAAPPADQVTERDDGLTAEEGAQFDAMRNDTSAPPSNDAPIEPALEPDAAAAAVAAGADEHDDDGDDEPAAGGAGGAPGAAGAAPDAGAADRKPRRVSWSKYERETKELKAALDKANLSLAEQTAMQARLDERLKIINEAMTTPPAAAEEQPKVAPLPKAEDDPEPNMEEDIFAWNQWNRRETLRLQQEVRETRQQSQQERQTETVERETTTAYMNDAEQFATQQPAFIPAYNFLMLSRQAELAVHYFGKDISDGQTQLTQQEQAKISQTIVNEEKAIVKVAIAAGRSPAAQLFAIAKSRGFKPQAAAAAAPAAERGNGKPTASAKPPNGLDAAQPTVTSVVDEVKRMNDGANAALSLSSGGGAPPAPLDAKRLADMPQDEFDRLVDQMSPEEWRRMMGGK